LFNFNPVTNRNDLCGCGSGKRFKHCCGSAEGSRQFRAEGLDAHRRGSLGQAEALYRRALETRPDDVDVLHMLGVVLLERLRYREALSPIAEAASRTGWNVPVIRHNLGFVLAKLMAGEANRRQEELLAEFSAWEAARRSARVARSPLVTVVVPTHDHAGHVADAIASVTAQTYPHIELLPIDNDQGVPVALNEGAARAQGQFLSFLDPNDRYAPDRIAALVEEIADRGVRWGFSLVAPFVDGAQPDPIDDMSAAERFWQMQRNQLGRHSNSFALLSYNLPVSIGNLFIERDLFHVLGGFRDFHCNAIWDLCLRAGTLAEPGVVQRPLYFYRQRDNVKMDTDRTMPEYLETALSGSSEAGNPLSPLAPQNRTLLLRNALREGMGELFPVAALRSLTAEMQARLPPRHGTAAAAPSPAAGNGRTAIVVLGMHRAGTSALARVLNLCGAALPDTLRPAQLNHNESGFWEPEEINELNDRTLRKLGGSWDSVAFSLPESGDLVDDFSSDLRALLQTEYGDREPLLIKDPRISVLLPLWHRALSDAGYRPAYVVLLRDPMEVAQSLYARGTTSVRKGLALWLAYMQRIAAFTDTMPNVVHVRFTRLLEDWEGAVQAISARLGLPLDIRSRANEVEQFLKPAMRKQVSPVTAATPALDEPAFADIPSLYQAFLARCDRDAELAQPVRQ
jgi:hypothetical protein